MAGTVSVCLSAVRHEGQLVKSLRSIEHASCEASVFVCDHSRNEIASEKFQWANPDISVLFRSRKTRYTEAINGIPSGMLCKYLLVMDPGITFDPDLITRMITYMETHPAIAVLSPLIVNSKGLEIPVPRRELSVRSMVSLLFGGASGPFRNWFRTLTMTDRVITAPVPVQIASSRFMFIRSDVFVRLGGFDPGYDRFLADCDFCQRILTGHHGSIVWHPEMPVLQSGTPDTVRENPFRKLISAFRYSVRWRIRL